ncbi:MAG: hypothetical protein ACK4MF_03205 [Hyphomicrobiaceae bacterium]
MTTAVGEPDFSAWRRRLKRRLALTSYQRATIDTDAAGANGAATGARYDACRRCS